MTSRINSIENHQYLNMIVKSLEPKQHRCIIQIDEVYLKTQIDYKSGSFFGFSVEGQVARTLLYFVFKFELNRPIIQFKYIPVSTLISESMMEHYRKVSEAIVVAGAEVLATITDNNCTNQQFLKNITTRYPNEEVPLIDTVHLIKCLRNIWYVKENLTFSDPESGNNYNAKWCVLENIYAEEYGNILKKK